MLVTVTSIKADVGSSAGHTKPSPAMLVCARDRLAMLQRDGGLLDFDVTYTGDDTNLLYIHREGTSSSKIHTHAWDTFKAMTAIAAEEGLYAAGQDLLVNAPSGNVRGAGPGCAEMEFELLPKHRPAEAFMVFTGDKCGPGMFGLPLYLTLSSPMHNTGLLLSPDLFKGFRVVVLDMNFREGDKVVELLLPEQHLLLAALLRNPDRFAIQAVYSRAYDGEPIVAVAADRLHNVNGVYTGKDDPAMVVRSQRNFPAPEEWLHPYLTLDQIITGDCRGSHNMPWMVMPINSTVAGAYCHPIVSAVGYSLNGVGKLSERIDFFGNPAWDYVRARQQEYAAKFRQQGFVGVALASQEEQAYTGFKLLDAQLEAMFTVHPAA